MLTKKTPPIQARVAARATAPAARTTLPAPVVVLAAALAALLSLSLWAGAAFGQTKDDDATKDPTPIAHAATGTYVRLGLGMTSLMGYDDGIALTAGLGDYAVFDRFRGEVELSFASASGIGFCDDFRCHENGVRTLALTANAYYDYRNRTSWTPFAGLGVGIESAAYSGGWNHGWREPAYSRLDGRIHGNLGVAYAATDDLDVQLTWRAFGQMGADRGWFHLGVRLNR